MTLAATDVCEDPAQYGRFSAPWTGIQQIKNGVRIEGGSRQVGGVLAVVQERGGSSAGMGWHLMPGVERRALPRAVPRHKAEPGNSPGRSMCWLALGRHDDAVRWLQAKGVKMPKSTGDKRGNTDSAVLARIEQRAGEPALRQSERKRALRISPGHIGRWSGRGPPGPHSRTQTTMNRSP